ncbi:MAG TPA: TrkH family potassium uptake protein, partial [Candidatus Brocadiaceae bacterium]
MNISIVLYTVGNLVLMLAGILLVPLGVAFYYRDDAAVWAFIYTIIITGVLGGISKAFFRKKNVAINIREGI